MAVRNFYATASIDGRKAELSGGPRRKDGGMDITLYQRSEGKKELVLEITCHADGDILRTSVRHDGQTFWIVSQR